MKKLMNKDDKQSLSEDDKQRETMISGTMTAGRSWVQ